MDPSAEHHHLPGGDLPPEPTAEPHPPYDPRSYMAQTVPERMAIISAGVIMNVIFAFIMATWAYLLGVKELPCKLSQVFAGGAAWEAGLQTGDEIVQIGDDLKDPIYDDLRSRVTLSDLREGVDFVIRREGEDELLRKTLHPKTDLGVPLIGVDGPRKLEIARQIDGISLTPANRADPPFSAGDQIRELNGVSVKTIKEWQRELVRLAKEPLAITVIPAPIENDDEGPADATSPQSERNHSTPLSIRVPVSRRKQLGLVMEMGPVVAIQANSPAEQAGVQVNDRLLSINGQPIGDPMTLADRLTARASQADPVTLRVRRGAEEINLQTQLRPVTWLEEIGPTGRVAVPALGLAYEVLANLQDVEPDSPAARAGIRKGDVIDSVQFVLPASLLASKPDFRQPEPVQLAEERSSNWPFVMEALQSHHPRGFVKLSYVRDGEKRQARLQPVESDEFYNADRGIGLALDSRVRPIEGFGEAARLGLRKTGESLSLVYRFLQRLSQNQISPKLLGGPVTIARVAGQSAEEGFAALLMFLTMLSANLAVVNFLPIPVLDGGHMVFLIYEGIMGKPPSERVFVLLSYLGLAFILTLMLFVLGLDFGFISRR